MFIEIFYHNIGWAFVALSGIFIFPTLIGCLNSLVRYGHL